MAKTFKILPKRWNFTKSGHTLFIIESFNWNRKYLNGEYQGMGCLKADIWANTTIFFKDLRGRELGSSKLRGSKLTIQPIRLEAISVDRWGPNSVGAITLLGNMHMKHFPNSGMLLVIASVS